MSRSDDRKMKELADRLVAMSPEPPPYPEEVSVTHREDSKPRPVLVFAGAALVVLLLAAIPLLLSRGGGEVDPVASSTTSTVPTTVTTQPQASTTVTTEAPATTTTVPATTTTTAPGVEAVEAVLYAVQTPENSFTGNPALVAFRGTVVPAVLFEEPMNPAYPGLYALTSENLFLPDGFSNMVPAAVEILGVTPGEHTVTVDMNEAFLAGSGSGLLGDFTMLNQMISTASAFGEIESVLFTVNGEPVTAFGSEGLDLSEPQGRDAYLDQLNSVNVDSPIQGHRRRVTEGRRIRQRLRSDGEPGSSRRQWQRGAGGLHYCHMRHRLLGRIRVRGRLPLRRRRDHSGLLAFRGGRVSQRCGLDSGPLGRPGRMGLHSHPGTP